MRSSARRAFTKSLFPLWLIELIRNNIGNWKWSFYIERNCESQSRESESEERSLRWRQSAEMFNGLVAFWRCLIVNSIWINRLPTAERSWWYCGSNRWNVRIQDFNEHCSTWIVTHTERLSEKFFQLTLVAPIVLEFLQYRSPCNIRWKISNGWLRVYYISEFKSLLWLTRSQPSQNVTKDGIKRIIRILFHPLESQRSPNI